MRGGDGKWEVFVWEEKKVLEMGGGNGAWLVSVLNAAKLHTEKWLNGKF